MVISHYTKVTFFKLNISILIMNRFFPLIAANNGHLTIVDLLLNYGATIDSKNHIAWTPLHYGMFCCLLILKK